MKTCRIAQTDLVVSRLAYGWASLGGPRDDTPPSAEVLSTATRAVHTAYENGITLYDHADVYSLGKSETVFGKVLKNSPGIREKIVIQTKCGIHISMPMANPPIDETHRFDSSYEHIVASAEASLRRLDTDYIDILLLHRPDALVDPGEVAKAFDLLKRSGKVRYFGLSNHTSNQIDLLKKYVQQPLVVNQVELGLAHAELITDGIDFNRQGGRRLSRDYTGVSGLLDYCRLHDIQIQAYSPIRGVLNAEDNRTAAPKRAARLLSDLAKLKNATPAALAIAWLQRHPAGIVPIIGASKPEHIVENCSADRLVLSRQEWYALTIAASETEELKIL